MCDLVCEVFFLGHQVHNQHLKIVVFSFASFCGVSAFTFTFSVSKLPSGGGGTLVLFVVRGCAIFRGTFFKKPLRNYGYHFHIFFDISRNF